MRYIGSKNKLSGEIAPVIQSFITDDTKGYLEPFVGGANMIDKIVHENKIGCDIHPQLIALLNKAKTDIESIPDVILEDEYNKVRKNKSDYEDWYVGLVGFCASFSAKYFGGYARDSKEDVTGKWTRGAIKNLKKQSVNLTNIEFRCCSFLDIPTEDINNYVIYCDIPYRDTTKYKTSDFPYDDFYNWVELMSINNTVLISEYTVPDGYEVIWSKETRANFDSNRVSGDDNNKRVEKLFKFIR